MTIDEIDPATERLPPKTRGYYIAFDEESEYDQVFQNANEPVIGGELGVDCKMKEWNYVLPGVIRVDVTYF